MEIKIRTGPEDLKKLIDFLHSDENVRRINPIHHLGTEEHEVFYLEKAESDSFRHPSDGRGVYEYNVTIGTLEEPSREYRERLNRLLEEL